MCIRDRGNHAHGEKLASGESLEVALIGGLHQASCEVAILLGTRLLKQDPCAVETSDNGVGTRSLELTHMMEGQGYQVDPFL